MQYDATVWRDLLLDLFKRQPRLSPLAADLDAAVNLLLQSHTQGGTIFTCGNGGSAADADHIVGELNKSFMARRSLPRETQNSMRELFPAEADFMLEQLEGGIPSISLMSELAYSTAYANDRSYEMALAQKLYVLGKQNDVLLALSTSGNSTNILHACRIAALKKIPIISMTSISGGELAKMADVSIKVPAELVYEVQELHLPIYHFLCMALEKFLFPA